MNSAIEAMLAPYAPRTAADRKNAMAEVIQEIALCGLSRAGLFDRAAFYGGTALRIFYGLDRYSEDLDFSLIRPDASFKIADYLPAIESEARSFGLALTTESKQKSVDTQIQSAFLKGDTQQHLLLFYPLDTLSSDAAKGERIKIKLEIDTDPAPFATFERKYRLLPTPYEVNLYDTPSLFAGKIHAVLCRGWKNRVKGRDLYDYVFYLSRGIGVNLEHLLAKLVQTGHLDDEKEFTIADVREMLCERFCSIDFDAAKRDVEPFLADNSSLTLWSSDFFCQITQSLTIAL